MRCCAHSSRGWSLSETAFLHTGLPFYRAQPALHGQRQRSFSGRRTAVCAPRARPAALPQDRATPASPWRGPGSGSIPRPLFRSSIPPRAHAPEATRAANCQFGDSGRNTVRGPHFTDSDIYIYAEISDDGSRPLCASTCRCSTPSTIRISRCPATWRLACPGEYIPAKFGTLESTISPPTGLLGVGLGGDSSPRMIAFQARIEF